MLAREIETVGLKVLHSQQRLTDYLQAVKLNSRCSPLNPGFTSPALSVQNTCFQPQKQYDLIKYIYRPDEAVQHEKKSSGNRK